MIRPAIRHTKRLLLLGAAIWGLTLICVAMVQLVWPRDAAAPAPADAIICLGAGAFAQDGTLRPDVASLRRALTCGRLQAAGVAPVVIFTGAINGPGSAAEAMARAAEAAGMPPEAALIEPDAMSTIQNAAFSLPMLPEGATRIVLVSDAFHLPRAWMIFQALGAPQTGLYAADPGPRAGDGMGMAMGEWVLRESVAIWFNAGRAAVYVAGGWIGIDAERRIGWFN